MIYIIDYDSGNVGSVYNMLKKIGAETQVIEKTNVNKFPKKLILPGVGSFDNGINNLESFGWVDFLNNLVLKKNIKILGICLGMQMMTKSSEEGKKNGLGWIDGSVKKFYFKDNLIKIPHMGWNSVITKQNSKLFIDLMKNPRFYHVHSYYVRLNNIDYEIAKTNYHFEFTSAFQKDNIYGVQFHPEKSHKYGMQLLRNFSKI